MYTCIHTSPHHDWNGLFKDYQVLNTYPGISEQIRTILIQFATLETNSINIFSIVVLFFPNLQYQRNVQATA